MSAWMLRYEGYEPEQEKQRETLCAVGNGYIATRGASPEMDAGEHHYPGTYAAGVFNRLVTEISGEEVENECMVNLPNWLVLTFRPEGAAWFRIDDVEVLEHVQELDMQRAVLERRFRYRDEHGRTTSVVQRRVVSMAQRHVCALETTIVPEDWSGRLEVRSMIDGRVENTMVERYRDLRSDHLEVVTTGTPSDGAVLLEVETNQSHIRIAMAARTTLDREGVAIDVDRRVIDEGDRVGEELAVDVTAGDRIRVEKVVAVFTSRDPAISEPAVEATRWISRSGDFASLLESHVDAWATLWNRFCFEAEGSEESLRVLRLHLLHLLQTVSPNSEDLDVGVPARGLHGEAYRGHILWDELFVFPLLNLRIPSLTRSLLRYRHRRLAEARRAAAEAGFAGAMFPWQSGSDGREESQKLHLNPASGRWIPDPTQRQRHIGIAVAYNVWQYDQVSNDEEFLSRFGAELLLDIARFWSSIARHDDNRDRYVICGVMGPDEFHTAYPGDEHERGIDNNAYTNIMAVWVLLRAREALGRLPELRQRELLDELGIDSDELERWEDITRKMFVPFHDDGIISQFEGYDDLEELDWEDYRRRYGDIARLDRILEAEDDTPNRYKASKQADTLMLFYLLSADELGELLDRLGYRLEPETIPRTIDHYLERTSHGSTLSAMVHAWVLTRAHRERGLEYYERALAADIADIQGGTTPEGIHLAAMCGSVDLVQRCFTGLEIRSDELHLDPYWPAELGTLTFSIQYRGVPLDVRVSGDQVEVSAGQGMERPINVACRSDRQELKPGSSVEFSH